MCCRFYRAQSAYFHRLVCDKSGTIAVIFAVSAIPIVVAVSIALDMSVASHLKSDIQAAADAGVLAAATRLAVNASDVNKEQLALDAFYANLSPDLVSHTGTPVVDIDFPAKEVHLAVVVNQTSLMGSLVDHSWNLHVDATATVSKGTPICMMALNPHKEEALTIQGTADLIATKCAVHVDSDDADNALHQHGSSSATAESFCVHGGHYGSAYTPTPKDKCWYENDPLEKPFAADWKTANIDALPCTYTNKPQINTGASTVTNLAHGVYCGGLNIKKGIVQLEAGEMYVFRNGALDIQAQGTLKGTGTPILFHGDDTTRLVTQAGASLIVSARTSGLFKGIVFAQHPSSIPAKENIIIGGGQMKITGIIYLPKQTLKITGNGDIGTTVAQFAIMADTIDIEGNGQLNIHIGQDYQDSGLPDLPEAHEVVHLIE
jgi:putative Flp pilus-assembly TadE/G-like protein